MKGEHYFKELLAGNRSGTGDRLLFALLRLASIPYAAVMQLRAAAYRSGLFRIRQLPVPVISIGNIAMGGTGKSPAVIYLARLLMARGMRVAVLTRGYGGVLEGETRIVSDGESLLLTPVQAGDEPCMMAALLPGLMIVMGPDRYRAGMLALERLAPDLFILDDGFQHLRLQRDLNILLLDAKNPFAGGKVFPAGFLREPVSASLRADLVIFTRCSGKKPPVGLIQYGIPTIASSHALIGWAPLSGGDCRPFAELGGRRCLAFAGIADPAGFFEALETEGVSLVATLAFSDHTTYDKDELEALGRLKHSKRADCLITTVKDAVKLLSYRGILGECCVAQMELRLHEPEVLLEMLEKKILKRG